MKGQSVVATRKLVDNICADDVPLLVLHDFDAAGMLICQTLSAVTDAARKADRVRYDFENEINVIDLGLRLADVQRWALASEAAHSQKPIKFRSDSIATPEERAFLQSRQRVELNAFASRDFINFIEEKLATHGIRKVVPDMGILEEAYRRAHHRAIVEAELRGLNARAAESAEQSKVPRDLTQRVKQALRKDSSLPWDRVVADLAREALVDGT